MKVVIAHGINLSTIENVYEIIDIGDLIEVVSPINDALTITNVTPMSKDIRHTAAINITKEFIKESQFTIEGK